MSFKDLGSGNVPRHVERPEDAELRAKAAARHHAKEARRAEEHHAANKEAPSGGAAKDEPRK